MKFDPQPPKPLEEMTEDEKRQWEDLLEDFAQSHPRTPEDVLDDIRRLLNESQIEAMATIKKHSRYGINCPYYLKAKKLYEIDNTAHKLSLLLEQFDKSRREQE
jgi:hypothetical protein